MADYPSEYELDIVLRDGETVQVRPITPDDGDLMIQFFESLGPESRYFRFFRVKRDLPPEEVKYFTTVDYSSRMALIVMDGETMIGVARYDRDHGSPTSAEVAFAVADDQQGRGIGTTLLNLLTAHARGHGVESFSAFVLPENIQMIRLFRNSGFEVTRTVDDGIYTVNFPVAYTDDARAAAEEREKRAIAASILPLFFPRSIAVIGASTRPGSIGNTLFRNLLHSGFGGAVYPVNPTASVVNSVRAYPSVKDIPDDVDMAMLAVPARHALQAVRDCAEKGVRGLVVITAGFSEVGGDGDDLEAELLDIVRKGGMRMVGPNCMGLLNTSPTVSMNGTFAPIYPPAGNIAMSSQSGALGIAILEYATRNGLGISQFVSVGNKADVSGNDLLLHWEDDPSTDVILLYLESFGNPRRFARIAPRIARKKPIVAVKSGRTVSGSRAASSHTGALASLDVAVDALFQQTGVIRTETLEEMFAVGAILANQPIPKGRRVGVITNAGGPAILAADALESRGLELPELSAELQARIMAKLPAEASAGNPVDMIAGAKAVEFQHAVREVLNSGEVDSLMVIYVPTSDTGASDVGDVIRQEAEAYEGDTAILSVFMQAEKSSHLLSNDKVTVPAFPFPENAARALARVVRHGEWLRRDPGVVPDLPGVELETARHVVQQALAGMGEDGGWLEADDVEAVLSSIGVALPRSSVVPDVESAVIAAAEIGGPVVLKVLSDEALHKSDLGGVLLDIEGEQAVRDGFETVTGVVENHDGVLVQEMISGGHEVLIGMTEDPNFGPMLVYGLGGVYVELLKDVAFRLAPLTDVDATEMIAEIKGAALMTGYRGMPLGDTDAVKDTLLRVSALVSEIPEIAEMDLNPVKVLEPGKGVCTVDARIHVKPRPVGWSPEIDDIPAVVS